MISVIIPTYNRKEQVIKAIESVLSQGAPNVEIIVVDDLSSDGTIDAIRELPVSGISLCRHSGQSHARNIGARWASGETLVFMDSDVVMPVGTLDKFKLMIIDAITSTPQFESMYDDLCSSHFNWRIRYNYTKLDKYVDFVYGSLFAIRKEVFDKVGGFKNNIGIEDNELGHDLATSGYCVRFDPTIQIQHYKKIGFFELLKSDFRRTLARVDYLLRRRKLFGNFTLGRFISTPVVHTLSPMIIALFWVTLHWGFLYLFFLCYLDYFIFLSRRGKFFRLPSLFLLLIADMTVVFFGLLIGVIKWLTLSGISRISNASGIKKSYLK